MKRLKRCFGLAVSAVTGISLMIFVTSASGAVTIESFSATTLSVLAGAHTDATTAFSFAVVNAPQEGPVPAGGDPQDIVVKPPPGLVGNPSNFPKCPRALLTTDALHLSGNAGGCPADSEVGEATIDVNSTNYVGPVTLGVYNIEPGPNEPAMLGIEGGIINVVPVAVPIGITASVHDDYSLTATIHSVPRQPFDVHTLGSTVTLWGVPGAHLRCNGDSNGQLSFSPAECVSPAPVEAPAQWRPFIEIPTSCSETPTTTLMVNTYGEANVFTHAVATSATSSDCADVPFAPSISLSPESTQAGAPTGLAFELTTPQSNDPNGRGTSELEKAVVTLPPGMTISPSAASKELQGCTDAQFEAGSDVPAGCPAASEIGTDEVESPLLPQMSSGGEGKLTGHVFLGQPLSTDPTSGKMFRVFQELRGFGLDVKVEGSVVANPETGQLTATFANLPELPFQTFRLHFNGGPNAVLVNPATCGQHTTTSQLTPYSGSPPATPSSTFTTSYDGHGAPCPAVLPFAPTASIATASSQAGAFSPLTVSFSRGDGTQPLGQITANLPPGLLGYVSTVQLCDPADAAAGTCPTSSRVGAVSATAGAGSDPLTVPGSVYLAHGTGGYPFALSVVVPAVAGPYDLGNVVVLVNLQVNSDGSVTAVSGPLPSILDGIPLNIHSVTLTADRPGFTFNPTNCAPLSLSGTATSLSGSVAPISAPFQVAGCASLAFAPSFTVATQGATSKANGASLQVRIAQKQGEADIHSVHVELPKQLPSRLTTLQKACTELQFVNDPAGCPVGSVVGTATAITPTLSSPLTGPAILVSHGGAAFPDLEIVLQGEGVTVILDGQTDIKHGITSSTFASAPDVPLSSFELTLPQGPYSLLAANGTLCTSKLLMPTTIVGWNGHIEKQRRRIAVTGCPTPKVKLVSSKVKRDSASLVLQAAAPGRLTVSGPGLKRTVRTLKRPGTATINVSLTRAGLASLDRRRRLAVKIDAALLPSKGTASSVATTLTFR